MASLLRIVIIFLHKGVLSTAWLICSCSVPSESFVCGSSALLVGATSLCTGSDEVPSDAPDYKIMCFVKFYNYIEYTMYSEH